MRRHEGRGEEEKMGKSEELEGRKRGEGTWREREREKGVMEG